MRLRILASYHGINRVAFSAPFRGRSSVPSPAVASDVLMTADERHHTGELDVTGSKHCQLRTDARQTVF